MEDLLSFDVVGRTGVLTLRDPRRRNSLSARMKAQLHERVWQLAHERELAALVITGEGGVFCSGGDLGELAGPRRTADADRRRLHQLHDWVQPLMNLELPVIAAVNGPAIGAGFGWRWRPISCCARTPPGSAPPSAASAWCLTRGCSTRCRAWWACRWPRS